MLESLTASKSSPSEYIANREVEIRPEIPTFCDSNSAIMRMGFEYQTSIAQQTQEIGNAAFNLARLHLDAQQAMAQHFIFHMPSVYHGFQLEQGNDEDILFAPGFLGTNYTLWDLATLLNVNGNRPFFGLDNHEMNEPTLSKYEKMKNVARTQVETTGRQIIGIGHSWGGIELAAIDAELEEEYGEPAFRKIITLGSPVGMKSTENLSHASNPAFIFFAEKTRAKDAGGQELQDLLDEYLPRPKSPDRFFAIWSERDGIIDSSIAQREDATNFQVQASHMGLPWDLKVPQLVGHVIAA